MGWLGENFWENQPWRGVGCRVMESLELASHTQPIQIHVESPVVFEEHQLQLEFPPGIAVPCSLPASIPIPPSPSVSQAFLLAAPIPVPTTATIPCPLELGTMGRGSPGWETEELCGSSAVITEQKATLY